FPLRMASSTWRALAGLAERLFLETLEAERELLGRPDLQVRLAVPRPLRRLLLRGVPTPAAARVARFDFHPTPDGWRISDINSDVPGGYTEATHLTAIFAEHFPDGRPAGDPTRALVDAIASSGGPVALVAAAGHLEDLQVVAHLAAALQQRGLEARV